MFETNLHPSNYFALLRKMKFHDELRKLCLDAVRGDERTFIPIRQWFHIMVRKPKTRYNQKCLLAETKYVHSWDQQTPLHKLLSKCPPLDVIELYRASAPEVVMMMDENGMLPLHVVCYNYHYFMIPYATHRWTLGLLDMLTKQHPETLCMKDRFGSSPLDIMKNRGWFQQTDNNEMMLLHHACMHVISLPLLKFIVDGSPDGFNIADNYGRTPSALLKTSGLAELEDECWRVMLHHICIQDECSNDILKLVLTAFPEAITMPDKFGLNPFHYACLNKSLFIEVLKDIILFCPEIIITNK
jgi:ankyrin repeat protein